jgi:seryl-tRNA synthetase
MLDNPLNLAEAPAMLSSGPIPTEATGVFLYPGPFEDVIAALRHGITALAADEPCQRLVIPPVISRSTIERAGYVKAFPQLLGTVHSYTGDGRDWAALAPLVERGGAWHAQQRISDLVLLPAACYPVYASLAGRSLDEPAKFRVEANCFRQELTSETGRLRSFRMVELVTVATEDYCVQWRAHWLERVRDWLSAMSLQVAIEVADDPFFGPGRKLFQAAQRAQELKFELKVAVADGLVQAVASANFHKDHFGETFEISADGERANTACMAFGMERIALALINAHGPSLADWPPEIRRLLTEQEQPS